MERGACFDSSGAYRYRLWREWDRALPSITFVMLNPSTADADHDDATVRRCIAFARSWGYGRLDVVNLCAFRATSPKVLLAADDPYGPENGPHIQLATANAALVVAAWGNDGRKLAKPAIAGPLHHLGLTKLGEPRHPSRRAANAQPNSWTEHSPGNLRAKTS